MKTILFVLLAFACTACHGPDINEVVLENLDEARAKGVLREGGWMPHQLPPDSTNIQLRYDVDTNEVWVAFDQGKNESPSSLTDCEAIEATELRMVRTEPRWWPDSLSSQRKPSDAPRSYSYYRCTDGSFAALSRAGKSYFWSLPV